MTGPPPTVARLRSSTSTRRSPRLRWRNSSPSPRWSSSPRRCSPASSTRCRSCKAFFLRHKRNKLERLSVARFFGYAGACIHKTSYNNLTIILKGSFTLALNLRRLRWWQRQATATIVLALATLGDATKNRNNPIFCRAARLSLSRALSRYISPM